VIDIGTSVAFPFRDPAWPHRVLVGAVLEVVPMILVLPVLVSIPNLPRRPHPGVLAFIPLAAAVGLASRFIVLGYLRRLSLAVLGGTPGGLPAWDRMIDDLLHGLKLWFVGVALFLPAIAVMTGLALLAMVVVSPGAAWLVAVLVGIPSALLTLLYLPAALVATVSAGSYAAAFEVERVLARIGKIAGAYALAFLVTIAAEIFAQLGLLAFCVGILATRFIAHCVAVHAFSSAWLVEPSQT
jgi:hypothetical protein